MTPATAPVNSISIEHTYTMVSYQMTTNGIGYIIKEGIDPNDGEQEVREIIRLDSNGNPTIIIQTHTDEWFRLRNLFEHNRTE